MLNDFVIIKLCGSDVLKIIAEAKADIATEYAAERAKLEKMIADYLLERKWWQFWKPNNRKQFLRNSVDTQTDLLFMDIRREAKDKKFNKLAAIARFVADNSPERLIPLTSEFSCLLPYVVADSLQVRCRDE